MRPIAPLFALSPLLLVACQGSSGTAPAPSGSSSASAAAPAETTAAAASSAAAPAAQKAMSAYSIVAEAPGPIVIRPMKGAAITTLSGMLFFLGEGPLTQDPSFLRGIKKDESAYPAGGEWPKAAWLQATDSEGNTKLYKWFEALGGRWEAQQILRDGESLLSIGVIGENAVAAIAMPLRDIRMQLVGGKGGVLPAPFPIKKEAPAGEGAAEEPPALNANCKVKMSPLKPFRLAGTPSGHAFAAGYECRDDGSEGPLLAERWEPKKTRGTVDPLPTLGSEEIQLFGVLAVSETEAYVHGHAGGAAYLARWDGKAWALEKPPFEKNILGMSATDDGVVFASADDGLFSRKAGGPWEKVALPENLPELKPRFVYARTASDVWVCGEANRKHYLLRSAQVEKMAEMPDAQTVKDTVRSNFRWPATPLCTKPYAHLFSVGPSSTPVPKEFPAVKKAFEGKKFDGAKLVLEDDGANLYVGAKAASAEQAQAILAAFTDANPKVKARIFCHDPQVKKELDWP